VIKLARKKLAGISERFMENDRVSTGKITNRSGDNIKMSHVQQREI
jgi:hypothetical protein